MSRRPPRAQTGFVLVLTLWFLAILTLAAGFFSLWLQRSLELAATLQHDLQAEVDLSGTQASLVYLLTTQRFTVAGLTLPPHTAQEAALHQFPEDMDDPFLSIDPIGNEIWSDDRPYQGRGGVYFALLDESGLVDVNYPGQRRLERLLSLLGVSDQHHGPLLAKLQDYSDPDDLHRVNGAESHHYRQLGLAPPSNRELRTPLEVFQVLGWRDLGELRRQGTWEHVTTVNGSGSVNLNSAPLLSLQTLDGFNADLARQVVEARPFISLLDVVARLNLGGDVLDRDDLGVFTSRSLRLTLWHPQRPGMRRVHLKLRPNSSDGRPWDLRYAVDLPRRAEYETQPTSLEWANLFTKRVD